MNTEKVVFNKLFKDKTNLSKKVDLNIFESYKKDLEVAREKFYLASGEMESIAIDLEFKEKEMLDYRAEYFNVFSEYVLDAESRLRELGINSLPDDWSREFDRIRNNIPEVESIKGIVDKVKNQFR
jgi:hypothetical protein